MLKIYNKDNSLIVEGINNSLYPDNGNNSYPLNSLIIVTDDSDIVTFRSAATNDVLFSGAIENITINGEAVTKDNIIEKFDAVSNVETGGGSGMTDEEREELKNLRGDVENALGEIAELEADKRNFYKVDTYNIVDTDKVYTPGFMFPEKFQNQWGTYNTHQPYFVNETGKPKQLAFKESIDEMGGRLDGKLSGIKLTFDIKDNKTYNINLDDNTLVQQWELVTPPEGSEARENWDSVFGWGMHEGESVNIFKLNTTITYKNNKYEYGTDCVPTIDLYKFYDFDLGSSNTNIEGLSGFNTITKVVEMVLGGDKFLWGAIKKNDDKVYLFIINEQLLHESGGLTPEQAQELIALRTDIENALGDIAALETNFRYSDKSQPEITGQNGVIVMSKSYDVVEEVDFSNIEGAYTLENANKYEYVGTTTNNPMSLYINNHFGETTEIATIAGNGNDDIVFNGIIYVDDNNNLYWIEVYVNGQKVKDSNDWNWNFTIHKGDIVQVVDSQNGWVGFNEIFETNGNVNQIKFKKTTTYTRSTDNSILFEVNNTIKTLKQLVLPNASYGYSLGTSATTNRLTLNTRNLNTNSTSSSSVEFKTINGKSVLGSGNIEIESVDAYTKQETEDKLENVRMDIEERVRMELENVPGTIRVINYYAREGNFSEDWNTSTSGKYEYKEATVFPVSEEHASDLYNHYYDVDTPYLLRLTTQDKNVMYVLMDTYDKEIWDEISQDIVGNFAIGSYFKGKLIEEGRPCWFAVRAESSFARFYKIREKVENGGLTPEQEEKLNSIPTAQVGASGTNKNYVYSLGTNTIKDMNKNVIGDITLVQNSDSIELKKITWGSSSSFPLIIPSATSEKAGIMSAEDKTKLDSLSEGGGAEPTIWRLNTNLIDLNFTSGAAGVKYYEIISYIEKPEEIGGKLKVGDIIESADGYQCMITSYHKSNLSFGHIDHWFEGRFTNNNRNDLNYNYLQDLNLLIIVDEELYQGTSTFTLRKGSIYTDNYISKSGESVTASTRLYKLTQNAYNDKQNKLSGNYLAKFEQNGGQIDFTQRGFDGLSEETKSILFKTINGQSLFGMGDIQIEGGGSSNVPTVQTTSTGNENNYIYSSGKYDSHMVLQKLVARKDENEVWFNQLLWGETSESTSKGGNVTISAASKSSAGVMSAADKVKLDSLSKEWTGTAKEYEALGTYDDNTTYYVVEE